MRLRPVAGLLVGGILAVPYGKAAFAQPATQPSTQIQAIQTQIDALLQAWPPRQRTKRRRALIGHAMSFATWRSLCVDQALPQRDAVAAMTRLVVDC